MAKKNKAHFRQLANFYLSNINGINWFISVSYWLVNVLIFGVYWLSEVMTAVLFELETAPKRY